MSGSASADFRTLWWSELPTGTVSWSGQDGPAPACAGRLECTLAMLQRGLHAARDGWVEVMVPEEWRTGLWRLSPARQVSSRNSGQVRAHHWTSLDWDRYWEAKPKPSPVVGKTHEDQSEGRPGSPAWAVGGGQLAWREASGNTCQGAGR